MKSVYSGHPSEPNRERWPDYAVRPVYSGHPSGPNQLVAIERWPDNTILWNLFCALRQLTIIERWPEVTNMDRVYCDCHFSAASTFSAVSATSVISTVSPCPPPPPPPPPFLRPCKKINLQPNTDWMRR